MRNGLEKMLAKSGTNSFVIATQDLRQVASSFSTGNLGCNDGQSAHRFPIDRYDVAFLNAEWDTGNTGTTRLGDSFLW